MNYKELQQECKKRGLSGFGKKAELEARLVKYNSLGEITEPAIEPEPPAPEVIVGRSFAFIGDPRNKFTGAPMVNMDGYMFKLHGDAVKVSDFAARRLAGNNHFKEV